MEGHYEKEDGQLETWQREVGEPESHEVYLETAQKRNPLDVTGKVQPP